MLTPLLQPNRRPPLRGLRYDERQLRRHLRGQHGLHHHDVLEPVLVNARHQRDGTVQVGLNDAECLILGVLFVILRYVSNHQAFLSGLDLPRLCASTQYPCRRNFYHNSYLHILVVYSSLNVHTFLGSTQF